MSLKLNVFFRRPFFKNEKTDLRVVSTCETSVNDIEQKLRQGLDIVDVIRGLDGSFAFAAETSDAVFLAVDRMCSIPMLFSIAENTVIASDSAEYIAKHRKVLIDKDNCYLYQNASFVPGNNTLAKDIFQILPGQAVVIDKQKGTFEYKNYFDYSIRQNPLKYSYDDFVCDAKRIAEKIAKKCAKNKVFIPLSSGSDSMFVATVVKLSGIKDITCFTYGKKNAKEKKASRRIAENYGFEWKFIEYKNDTWQEFRQSGELKKYADFAGNLANCVHIQDFPAVSSLLKDISENERYNCVFMPGHTGTIGGGNVKTHYFNREKYSTKNRISIYGKKDFNLLNKGKRVIKKCDVIQSHLNSHETDIVEEVSFFQTWDIRERQAKAILPSLRVYEYFGASWFLPMNDALLMENLYGMPLNDRLDKKTYKSYCRKLYSELTGAKLVEQKNKTTLRKIIGKIIRPFYKRIHRALQYWLHDLRWFSIANTREKILFIIKGGTAVTSVTSDLYLREVVFEKYE